jgi:mannose/fructose-specific phosphotransferase system component IIA
MAIEIIGGSPSAAVAGCATAKQARIAGKNRALIVPLLSANKASPGERRLHRVGE